MGLGPFLNSLATALALVKVEMLEMFGHKRLILRGMKDQRNVPAVTYQLPSGMIP